MKNLKDFNSYINEAKKVEKPYIDLNKDKDDYVNKIEEVINDQYTEEERRIEIIDKFEDRRGKKSGKLLTNIIINRPNEGEQDFPIHGVIGVGNSTHNAAFTVDLYKNVKLEHAVRKEREEYSLSKESIDKIVKIATIINSYVKIDHKLFDKIIDKIYALFSDSK